MVSIAAGRELDALIAAKVMGLIVVTTQEETSQHDPAGRWVPGGEYYEVDVTWALPPDINLETDDFADHYLRSYSTRIDAAWEVVEALLARGVWMHALEGKWEKTWRCTFEGRHSEPGYSTRWYQAMGDTAPHAICLAALQLVGAQ